MFTKKLRKRGLVLSDENPGLGAVEENEGEKELFDFESSLIEYLNYLVAVKDLSIAPYSTTGDNVNYNTKSWLAFLLGSSEDPWSKRLTRYGILAAIILAPVLFLKILFGGRRK